MSVNVLKLYKLQNISKLFIQLSKYSQFAFITLKHCSEGMQNSTYKSNCAYFSYFLYVIIYHV